MTLLPQAKLYIDGQLRDAANGAKCVDETLAFGVAG